MSGRPPGPGSTDREQLLFAGRDGRCFITQAYRDIAALTAEFYARGLPHAGALFISPALARLGSETIADEIARFATEHPEGMKPYTIEWLDAPPDRQGETEPGGAT